MATVFDSTSNAPNVENFYSPFAIDIANTNGLNLSLVAGEIIANGADVPSTINATTVALANNAVNVISINLVASTIVNDGIAVVAPHAPIYTVTTTAGAIINVVDMRTPYYPAISALSITASAIAAAASATAAAASAASINVRIINYQNAAYTILTTDRNKLIEYGGAGGHTYSLPTTATLGSGFEFQIKNVGTGVLTVNANAIGGTTIDGAATIPLSPEQAIVVVADAVNNHYEVTQSRGYAVLAAASTVSFTPVGSIIATDVQAALAELDTEKAALAGSASQVFSVANGTGSQAINRTQADALYVTATGTNALKVNDFRLTLASGVPVTTTDVTGATNVYLAPYMGNRISLYTGGAWALYSSTQVTLALGTLTAALPYDVFVFDNGGVVTLTAVAWTNATTRATALAYQDGVLCTSGNTSYRYLGTFYTTSTTTTEDSLLKRNLWNYYHRVDRMMVRQDTTGSWTYTTAAWRQANNSAANQLEAVQGVAEDMVAFSVFTPVQNTSAGVVVASGIGFDSTAANSALGGGAAPAASAVVGISLASYEALPAAGWHKYCWLEYSAATGTTTWLSAAAAVLYAAMKGKVKA